VIHCLQSIVKALNILCTRSDPLDMLDMTVIVVFNFCFMLMVLSVPVVLNEQRCHILKKQLCNRIMLKPVCNMSNVFHRLSTVTAED